MSDSKYVLIDIIEYSWYIIFRTYTKYTSYLIFRNVILSTPKYIIFKPTPYNYQKKKRI